MSHHWLSIRTLTFYPRVNQNVFPMKKLIKEFFKKYLDDSFIFWPKHLDFNSFSTCLNNLPPAIKYTFEKAKVIVQNSESCQMINFLDVSFILHPDRTIKIHIL